MNKMHLVVSLDDELYVYNLRTLQLLKKIKVADSNGLFSLCCGTQSLLAFPKHGVSEGIVNLFELGKSDWRPMCDISAHKNAISAMQISLSGSLIATASATGTVIRVFELPSGNKLCSFRRGHKAVEIASLSFCSKETFLAVVSSSGTVHIFCLADAINSQGNTLQISGDGYMNSIFNTVAKFAASSNLVPNSLKEIEEVRARYIAAIPSYEGKCKASLVYPATTSITPTVSSSELQSSTSTLPVDDDLPMLYLVTDGGYFFR
jgi:hypothetical protein